MDESINKTMITKYISKHYRFYKVYLMNRNKPISVKNPLKFEMIDNETNTEVNTYFINRLIMKIFNVDEKLIREVINSLAINEFDRLCNSQMELFQ